MTKNIFLPWAITSLTLLACSNQTTEGDVARNKAPNYAMFEIENARITWNTNCYGRITVVETSVEAFYTDEGKLRTKKQYCDIARKRILFGRSSEP